MQMSARKQQKMFKESLPPGSPDCVFRRRRGSDLARGYWKQACRNIQHVDSDLLQQRLTLLCADDRADLLANLASCLSGTSAELFAKWSYWGEVPHLMLGLWPADEGSMVVAGGASCTQPHVTHGAGPAVSLIIDRPHM